MHGYSSTLVGEASSWQGPVPGDFKFLVQQASFVSLVPRPSYPSVCTASDKCWPGNEAKFCPKLKESVE